ncbi:uncharacterized protein LOC133179933 [Saccostrea echinata]|uniref:uncharacterized protein LOC133179933 n=1 Tax=Saccostrea echinata TaxID=191078 RepID=UPI002A80E931|nr:uncharacterized protein LOC133179933 [Saccostrea echinata]
MACSSTKYANMTIKDLKDELKKRNARLSGRKKELFERLIAYDRNQNFGQTEDLEPEYRMTLPDPLSYFDVNADSTFSGTTLEKLTSYLAKFDNQLDNKVKRLYNERTIRYFKISYDNDLTYVASSCYAEYRTGISYEMICYLTEVCL